MKKGEVTDLNQTLLYVVFGDMSKKGTSTMMKNLVSLDKMTREVEGAMKLAVDKFKPVGFEVLLKKERSEEEQKEFDKLLSKYDSDMKGYLAELINEEVDLEFHSISEADFNELVDATSKATKDLSAGNFMYLRTYLVNE